MTEELGFHSHFEQIQAYLRIYDHTQPKAVLSVFSLLGLCFHIKNQKDSSIPSLDIDGEQV